MTDVDKLWRDWAWTVGIKEGHRPAVSLEGFRAGFAAARAAPVEVEPSEIERLRHENDCLQAQVQQLDYPCSPHCQGYLREQQLRRQSPAPAMTDPETAALIKEGQVADHIWLVNNPYDANLLIKRLTDSLAALPQVPAPVDQQPFAHFRFNNAWKAWEQVTDDAIGDPAVVAAYRRPTWEIEYGAPAAWAIRYPNGFLSLYNKEADARRLAPHTCTVVPLYLGGQP